MKDEIRYYVKQAVIVILTAALTWIGKDIVMPCPSVECAPINKLYAEVDGTRGDLIWEDCKAVHFFNRAELPDVEDSE
jgi:hypothetical protein